MIDLLQIITERRIQGWQLELQRVEPAPVRLGPGLRAGGRANTAAQQKLPQTMAGTELVLFGRLTGPDEIAQRFMRRIRYPHRREIAGTVAARKLGGVASVRLHAIAGLGGHEGGRDDVTRNTQAYELPVKHVSAGARLVTHAEPVSLAKLANQLCHRIGPIGNDAKDPDLTVGLRDRGGDGLGVDIQTQVPQVVGHRPAPSHVALRGLGDSDRVTYALRSEPVIP